MDFSKLILLINTIKYLRFRQILYRFYYFFKKFFLKTNYNKKYKKDVHLIFLQKPIPKNNSFLKNNTFLFLNIEKKFEKKIIWNYNHFGKLWTYNLNYFDFLNQKKINKSDGLFLINDFISNYKYLNDGLEPYPISLRCINWIKFLSREKIKNKIINQCLYNQYIILSKNLEYHLLGNHLLENAFSLLFGSFFFEDEKMYLKAKKIILNEIEEQVLSDGCHFELSPMYHKIILEKLLDCINLFQNNTFVKDKVFLNFLMVKATLMLSWLKEITFSNDTVPHVNDSTFNIASRTSTIIKYAKKLNVVPKKIILNDSGYRFINHKAYQLFLDIADVGPSYQPGHAHADTFNFVLFSKIPLIVDPSISTYNIGKIRDDERSTKYHNTVTFDKKNSSQIWSGFRVGNRAKVKIIKDNETEIIASHDGYKNLGIIHKRKFKFSSSEIIISDIINNDKTGHAHFHFHPDLNDNILIFNNTIQIKNLTINFAGNEIVIEKLPYKFSYEFNKRVTAIKLRVGFKQMLQTKIQILET